MTDKSSCPQCGFAITGEKVLRCPRCNKILAQHETCNGCGKCASGKRLKKS